MSISLVLLADGERLGTYVQLTIIPRDILVRNRSDSPPLSGNLQPHASPGEASRLSLLLFLSGEGLTRYTDGFVGLSRNKGSRRSRAQHHHGTPYDLPMAGAYVRPASGRNRYIRKFTHVFLKPIQYQQSRSDETTDENYSAYSLR